MLMNSSCQCLSLRLNIPDLAGVYKIVYKQLYLEAGMLFSTTLSDSLSFNSFSPNFEEVSIHPKTSSICLQSFSSNRGTVAIFRTLIEQMWSWSSLDFSGRFSDTLGFVS